MAVLSVFCDESGKFRDQTIISFSAVWVTLETLERFENKWRELLRRHELKPFKISDAVKSHRPYGIIPSQSEAERIKALNPFAACIGENFEYGIEMAVNVEAFRRTNQDVKKRIAGGDDPFYFAFLRVLLAVMERVGGEKVAFVCDDDQETAANCLSLYRRLKNMNGSPELESLKDISAITFADDEVFLPLQASDVVAGLARMEAGRQFLGERYGYGPLFGYMIQDRGPMYTKWGFVFAGERNMARIEQAWGNSVDLGLTPPDSLR